MGNLFFFPNRCLSSNDISHDTQKNISLTRPSFPKLEIRKMSFIRDTRSNNNLASSKISSSFNYDISSSLNNTPTIQSLDVLRQVTESGQSIKIKPSNIYLSKSEIKANPGKQTREKSEIYKVDESRINNNSSTFKFSDSRSFPREWDNYVRQKRSLI